MAEREPRGRHIRIQQYHPLPDRTLHLIGPLVAAVGIKSPIVYRCLSQTYRRSEKIPITLVKLKSLLVGCEKPSGVCIEKGGCSPNVSRSLIIEYSIRGVGLVIGGESIPQSVRSRLGAEATASEWVCGREELEFVRIEDP